MEGAISNWMTGIQALICAVEKLTIFESKSMELVAAWKHELVGVNNSETQGLGYKRFNYPTENHLRAKQHQAVQTM